MCRSNPTNGVTCGSGDQTQLWVTIFCFFFLFFLFYLQVSVNLKFYKIFRSIKVILPILLSNLTPTFKGGGHCKQLKV